MVKDVQGMARLGVLAVGLGIGAAWAHTPVASADSSSDWSSTIDSLLSGASARPGDTPRSGHLVRRVYHWSTTATPSPEPPPGITAWRSPTATVPRPSPTAPAAPPTPPATMHLPTSLPAPATSPRLTAPRRTALAGGAYTNDPGGNYDTAIDIGNNRPRRQRHFPALMPGNGDLAVSTSSGTGSYDTAIDIGNNTNEHSAATTARSPAPAA